MSSRHRNNYVNEEDEATPLLTKNNMETENSGYTADNNDGSNPAYDPSGDSTTVDVSGHRPPLEESSQGLASTSSPTDEENAESLFRSERMTLCQLFLQSEAAFTSVSYLGELGNVEFRDLNPETSAFQRKFVGEVRRCDEMERKLRFLEKEIKKDEMQILEPNVISEAPQPREMIDMEATFEKLEVELQGVNQNSGALQKNYVELTELKHILQKTQKFFEEQGHMEVDSVVPNHRENQQPTNGNKGDVEGSDLSIKFMAGVINRERIPAFERTLWRACRGNVFLKQAAIAEKLEDVHTGNEKVNKSVVVIFFQGEQLKSKVKKICEGYRATMYPCPELESERKEMVAGVLQRLEDLKTVLSQTKDHRSRILAASAKHIKVWLIKIRKLKAVYHVLNMFSDDVTQKCLIAECWVPTADIDVVQLSLKRASEKSGSSVPPILNQIVTKESPPTFFRTNKLTSAFQELINAYGVASYREVNPAVYTIITFPFLFGIMFGDAGHGTIMLIFALWMILQERKLEAKKIDSEIWKIFFSGRYLICIMSIFSIFTGLIYNDIFSKSLNIFHSSFQVYQDDSVLMANATKTLMIDPAPPYCDANKTSPDCNRNVSGYYGSPYVFGIDPVWQVAENKIEYQNAFKMKVSIILGVIHMLFGVFMSLKNHLFFKDKLSIFAEFLPQVIFLCGMFGYLSFLMVIKWWLYFASNDPKKIEQSEGCAPSVLITFINMVMFKGDEPLPNCGTTYMYKGQHGIQIFLLIASVLCIPIMLLVKPFVLKSRNKKKQYERMSDGSEALDETTGTEGEFEFSEVMILQGIHTIEYVLGSVSHTASYLRLWALSLAHSQLSEVLWNMVMSSGFQDGILGAFMLYPIFAGWAALTVSILVVMEGLSAFLHTLRLHWVEFNSKFYHGEGVLFTPFSFKSVLAKAEEEPSS